MDMDMDISRLAMHVFQKKKKTLAIEAIKSFMYTYTLDDIVL
jgi:hypothetical protein